MADPSDKAPPTAASPATTTTTTNEVLNTDEHKDKPRDSKGWDGKLRLDKSVVVEWPRDPRAGSDAEDESEDEGPLPEQLAADEDLLDDVPLDEEEIDLVHLRISSVHALRLERFGRLKRLCLRQNQIVEAEIPEQLASTLVELDLYDNLISHIRGFDAFTELTSLDLSFNKIKHIKRLDRITKLQDLYFVQNKIGAIEGLESLTELRQIELGANRIREIENLELLTKLEQLWLGKNKITEIKGLDTLTNLKILSIQSNRLTSISGLSKLSSLEELHISHNAITEISGLESNTNLHVIDVSSNPLEHLTGLKQLAKLQELWASNCKLSSFQEIEAELGGLEELETVYFEGNPVQRSNMVLYRNKVRLALPRVSQIDATFVKVS